MAPAAATPEKQFIFEGVRIDEHDQNGRSWVGTAKRASGDLSRSDAEGIRIRHYPEDTGGRPVDILAPRGQLEFDDHGHLKFMSIYPHETATGKPVYPRP